MIADPSLENCHVDCCQKTMLALKRCLAILLPVLAATCPLYVNAQDRAAEYQVGPGDTIRIQVYQNSDLTLETRVTENGMITFPLIGPTRIGGLTIAAAEQRIARALQSGGFIREPQVNILTVQIRGNQVSVLGQVIRPGRFPLETANIRLSEMLAIAGGISATGADVVVLTGVRDGKPFHREVDVVGMFTDKKLHDDLVVAGGDVIYVHRQPMFYIYGEVQRPGSYRIERGMSVRQALSQGGGLTPRGTERNVRIHRRGVDGAVESTSVELNSLVKPDDVIHVRESLF